MPVPVWLIDDSIVTLMSGDEIHHIQNLKGLPILAAIHASKDLKESWYS